MFSNTLKNHRKGKTLIAAHRGTCGANVIQNTYLSSHNALLHGADIVELDAVQSADGVFYAFHDGEEKSLWGFDADIRTMTSRGIDRQPCRNSLDMFIDQRVERLRPILERLRGRCLINIDRSWYHWDEMLAFLEEVQMYDQIILKAPPKDEFLKRLEQSGSPVMFMPIIRTMDEWKRLKSYQINVVAAEIIFETVDADVFQPEFISELHKEEILVWVNALTLHDDITLSANLDDNGALINGYDTTWGRLIDRGVDIIQTDWPALLKKYVESENKR